MTTKYIAFALCAAVPCSALDVEEYPRAGLLIEPGELAQAEVSRSVLIFDVRDAKKHSLARVPGARWIDAASWAKAFGQGQDADAWSRRIGGAGIGAGARVALYDDSGGKDAARIWWILRYWGVEDAWLLNGGWRGWEAAALPVERGDFAPPAPVAFAAKGRPERLATKDELLSAVAGKATALQIIDARSAGEFCGTDTLGNARAGAIPGATHLDWVELVDGRSHRFKPAAELRRLFAGAGIELNRPAATHCQSGGRSSVMVFALELMGAQDVQNYYASWAEWGNAADTPVVPGVLRVGR